MLGCHLVVNICHFIPQKIFPSDVEDLSHGEYNMEFLTIEHNTGIKLNEEFIMVGREMPGYWNHSVYPRRMPDQYGNKQIPVHKISDRIFMSQIQFDEPFGYSTKTWAQGNTCDKNVTKFKTVQKHYVGQAQSVNVITQAVSKPFQYFLRSGDNPPHLRFLIPGRNHNHLQFMNYNSYMVLIQYHAEYLHVHDSGIGMLRL